MLSDLRNGAHLLALETSGGATRFQGQFEEAGTTGMRDALAYELCRRENLIAIADDGMQGLNAGPCDPEWKHGASTSLSEKADHDGTFPGRPLSLARAFASCALGKAYRAFVPGH